MTAQQLHSEEPGRIAVGISPVAARFITGVTWQDLPGEVVEKAALCLIDTVGAMLAGRQAGSSQIAGELARNWWPAAQSHLILDGSRSSAAGAAFANAVAANAVDIDDVGIYTWGHPGAQVVPSALALAESQRLSGRDLLTAIVVGYEIAFRAGRCLNYEPGKLASAERTYRACASWGSVACAAVACHLLRFDETRTSHALGIAEYHSPDVPMMRDVDTPAMVKHGIGMGALTGILSADLARRGFTGIVPSLHLPRFADFVSDLGSSYLLPNGITWKRYACCAWAHPALLAVESIAAQEPIDPAAIHRIVVETYPDAVRLGTRMPTTTEEAQFNLAWPIAAQLIDHQVGPAQMLRPAAASPLHRALCERTEAHVSADLTELYYLSEVNDPRGKDAARVTITLADGRELSSGTVEHVLYPDPGWGFPEVARKFHWLADGQLAPAAAGRLLAGLHDIQAVKDIGAFMSEFAASLTTGE